jgi:4-amino-4-deoxy-L-arabinose transferase-like glycosyltransferase
VSEAAPSGPSEQPTSAPPTRSSRVERWLGRAAAHPVASLAALQLVVVSIVYLTGFRAVSDDDYARVVIAQELVHTPKLDPSGTSWLPLPFWIQGAFMALLGRGLEVARLVAVLSALACGVLVHRAALLFGARREAAWLGAALALALPWSARMSVATVPELPVAALSLFAVATLAPGVTPKQRLLGGVALLGAGLSRYEPWIVGALFALVSLRDARRARLDERPIADLLHHVGAALAAVSAPAAWSAWNAEVHGSAVHYLHRVAAYKKAIDGGQLVSRILEYPFAVLRAEPELLVVGLVVFARWWPDRHERRALRPYALPAAVLAVFVVVLVGLSVRGGAPTHHPERALHVVLLFGALLVARLGLEAHGEGRLGRREITVLVASLALAMPFVRAWWLYKESFAPREAEVAIGREVATKVEPGALVLVETIDYGYFAVQAASGRPESVKPEGRVDPVHGGAPMAPHQLAIRARLRGARYVVGREPRRADDEARALAEGLEPVARTSGWVLWQIGPRSS